MEWIDIIRDYQIEVKRAVEFTKKILITDKYTYYEPLYIKTQLLEHQKRALKAMIDLEKIQKINVNLHYYSYGNTYIETNAGIFSDKPGSGKTYVILALILNYNPPRKPILSNLPFLKTTHSSYKNINEKFNNSGYRYSAYKTFNNFMPQTLIFVGPKVLSQWLERINKYTNLKTFIINSVFDIRKFYELFKKGEFLNDKYQVILIKNGNISGKLEIPEIENSYLHTVKSKSTISVLGEILKTTLTNRVVLDDYDFLGIPTNAKVIPSLFTWFVSATRKKIVTKHNIQQYHDLRQLFTNNNHVYVDLWNNREVLTFCNIGCDSEYINKSTDASMINYYLHTIKSHNDKFISLIEEIQPDKDYTEMLNANSMQTISKLLDTGNNILSIFRKILDKSWNMYQKNLAVEKYILHVLEYIDSLPIIEDLDKDIYDKVIKNIQKTGPFKGLKELLEYKYIPLIDVLNNLLEENKKDKEKNSLALERVKNNFRDGECPITAENLKDCKQISILICCGLIINTEALKMFTNQCVKCRRNFNKDHVITIDGELNIELLLNDKYLKLDIENNENPQDDKTSKLLEILNGKFNVEKNNNIIIPGLLAGPKELPEPLNKERKFLIYSSYSENMNQIKQILETNKIKYGEILGKKTSEIINNYYLNNDNLDSISTLLISGKEHCASLDLQNTTDLIFTHMVNEQNTLIQIAGRAARIGRKHNLNIHFIAYNNEKKKLENS